MQSPVFQSPLRFVRSIQAYSVLKPLLCGLGLTVGLLAVGTDLAQAEPVSTASSRSASTSASTSGGEGASTTPAGTAPATADSAALKGTETGLTPSSSTTATSTTGNVPAATSAPLAEAPIRSVATDDEDEANLPALDQSVVKDVVMSYMPAIKNCYNQELKKDPALAGKVVIRFTVGPKGTITQAVVASSTLKNKEVEGCMLKEVKSWIFPEPRRGESVDISFPFVFKGI